ncbi:MAG: TetR/AcrR family transcriptional regulator [Pseudonocardiaceae bacterium]
MPKIVDHRARRTLIAAALLRVTASRGLEAVSVRHVATEAGVSPGMVQHYFRTKDQMLQFALDVISERVERRIGAGMVTLGDDPSPRDLVRTLLIEILPIDDERRLEAHIAVAFGARAAAMPSIATRLREQCAQLLEFLTAQLRLAQQAGEVSAQLNADHEARGLLALMDGLAMHTLIQNNTGDMPRAIFDHYLDRLFCGSG